MNSLAIIILNYYDYNITQVCVENLIKLGVKSNIVIVDNNSPNESYKILKEQYSSFSNIHVIKTLKNGGYSYGNNFGIKYINSISKDIEYICIMNPDIEIRDILDINVLIDSLKCNKDLVLVTGVPITNDKLNLIRLGWSLPGLFNEFWDNLSLLKIIKKENKNYNFVEKNNLVYTEVVSGCFFVIKNIFFYEVNLFDEGVFLYFEENILSAKIKEKNKKVAINIRSKFWHNHKSKDNSMLNIKNKINDFKIFSKSRRYYVKNYCNKGKNFWWILYITEIIHTIIEIPIIHLVNNLVKRNKK